MKQRMINGYKSLQMLELFSSDTIKNRPSKVFMAISFFKVPTIHTIELLEEVRTPKDGFMKLVSIKYNDDLSKPCADVCAPFATINHIDEIWLWNNKYWMKALDKRGNAYYNLKKFLLYELSSEASEIINEIRSVKV